MLRNPKYVHGSMDLQVPARQHFGEFILEKMCNYREKIAITNGYTNESITYGQMMQEAINFAVSLTHLGLRKGQAVAICSENRMEYWSVVIGVACAGAVMNTVNSGYSEDELKHVMSISKPTFVVCSPSFFKLHGKTLKSLKHVKSIILLGNEKQDGVISFQDLATSKDGAGDLIVNNRLARNVKYEEFEVVDVDGQIDTFLLPYSSGTTGLPKGVMLTHLNIIAQCCLPVNLDSNRTYLIITPWFHVMGLVGTLIGFAWGRTVVYLPRFEINLYLKTIEKYKINQLSVVPPVAVAIAKFQGQYDLNSVEWIFSGAAPLHREAAELLKAKFPSLKGVYQSYGMTEAGMAITRFTLADLTTLAAKKPGSVGKLVPGVVAKIVDIETRKPLGPHQTGELCVKGVIITKGYVGKDRREDFDNEGFFKTGDVGYYDEDKCFYIVDRLKELIKYKGFQVAPAEIEGLLLKHEAIRDAGVVGLPDKTAGELPLAFVVLQPGKNASVKEIQDFVAKKLSSPKHLRGGVRFVSAIPKNPSGKILRRSLRQMAQTTSSKL